MQIGSRGWQHRQWLSSFYPDDLPPEWRLPYYSNEFDIVLIPSSELLSADREQLQEWLDDCTDDFSFFVEFDTRHELSAQLQMAQVLHPQLAGIVLNTTTHSLPMTPENIKSMAANTLGDHVQVYAPEVQQDKKITTHGAHLVYELAPKPPHEKRCLGLLKSDSISTTELKALLGALHKREGGCDALFFAGPKPEIELIRQATNIYQLSY